MKFWLWRVWLTLLLVGVFGIFFESFAQEVKIEANPRNCDSSCQIEVKVTVKTNRDNYLLVLMWANVLENDDNAGTTRWQIDGENYLHTFTLNKGCYYLVAALYRRPKGTPFAEAETSLAVGVPPCLSSVSSAVHYGVTTSTANSRTVERRARDGLPHATTK